MDSFFDKSDENEILYFSINQEYNCISVGTSVGFKIFSTEPLQLVYESKCGPIAIIEMLHTTNLVLLIGLTDFGDFSPRKVTIWSTSENAVICSTWSFTNKISLAKINKKRMIVCEKNFLHIYATQEMKLLHTIDIGLINFGKIILSPSSEKNNYVCYSSSSDEGIVQIYDLNYLAVKTNIKAHKTPISKMAINNRGDMLATCSTKGTIIRVFAIPKGEKLFTYKRGLSSASIYSMNFSLDSEKLITTSDTGTLHVFNLREEAEEEKSQSYLWLPIYMSNFISNFTSKIVPKDYEDYIGLPRSIISYNSNILKVNNIVSFNKKNTVEAYCFTSDGSYFLFTINYENNSISLIYECNIKDLKLII